MYHYDAFISYNHNPRDMKIADLLQNRLENYRAPSDLKKIERIFLDKGELEVAGDLNSIIQEALENSDHLIVICSPESRDSIWVHKEIEYYLKFHSIDSILTVITDGEPFDVLPDILLSHEVINDEGETVTEFREPLSCDYRLPVREANRKELPRLAAALMHCRYDDLMQRQKAYRMKRQVSLLSCAAVILISAIGYLIWSNNQIRDNLNSSLREQSLNLAMQSEAALASGDRIGAIRYAIDALPSADNKRPVVSEAALALSNALRLYKTPNEEGWTATKKYSTGSAHSDILPFNLNGTDYMAELYNSGQVRLWNIDTSKEIMADYTGELLKSGTEVRHIVLHDKRYLVLVSRDQIISIDIASEKERYNHKITGSDPDSSITIYEVYDSPYTKEAGYIWCDAYIYPDDKLIRIDMNTGEIDKELSLAGRAKLLQESHDGKCLAAVISDYTDSPEDQETFSLNSDPTLPDRLEFIDSDTGKILSYIDKPYITDIAADAKGRFFISGFTEEPDDYDISQHNSFNYIQGNRSTLMTWSKERTVEVFCTDGSGKELWSKGFDSMYTGSPWLEPVTENVDYNGACICTVGSNAMIIGKDGSLLESFDFRSTVKCYYNRRDMIRAVLQNGSMAFLDPEDHILKEVRNVFIDPAGSVVYDRDSKDTIFYITTSDDNLSLRDGYMLQFEYLGADIKWQDYDIGERSLTDDVSNIAIEPYNDCFVEIRNDRNDDIYHVIVRRMSDGTLVNDIALEGGITLKYSCMDPDTGKVYFVNIDSPDVSEMVVVDINSGDIRRSKISFPPQKTDSDDDSYVSYSLIDVHDVYDSNVYDIIGDSIYYAAAKSYWAYEGEDLAHTYTLDILTLDTQTSELSAQEILALEEDQAFDLDGCIAINAEAKQLVMLGTDQSVTCYGFNGQKKWTLNPLDFAPLSPAYSDDGSLLIAETDAYSGMTLHIYETSGGREITKSDFGKADISYSGAIRSQAISGEETLLSIGHNGFIIDNETKNIRTRILNDYISFNPQTREFILGSTDRGEIGHVPYRTLDEMIAEGQELLD